MEAGEQVARQTCATHKGELVDFGQKAVTLPVERWHEMLGDPTIADAILDRLVHTAYRLDLKGESMRKLMAPKHGHAGPALAPVGPQGILPRAAPPAP